MVEANGRRSRREGRRTLPTRASWTRALASLCSVLAASGPLPAQPPPPIRVEMVEFAYRPGVIRLASGRAVRLALVNNGHIAHQIEAPYLARVPATVVASTVRVEAAGVDIVRLDPGGAALVEFTPRAAGRFPFACTIEGHQEAGMRGYLDVR